MSERLRYTDAVGAPASAHAVPLHQGLRRGGVETSLILSPPLPQSQCSVIVLGGDAHVRVRVRRKLA